MLYEVITVDDTSVLLSLAGPSDATFKALAAERGLRLPLVYNTGGYDALESLRWLDGVVDRNNFV